MSIELKVPSVGESITEVFIGQWRVRVGDAVKIDTALVEIESDKATVDLNAPAAGVIEQILKKQGDSASVGEVIGYMSGDGAPAPAKPGKPEKKEPTAEKKKEEKPAIAPEPPKPAAKEVKNIAEKSGGIELQPRVMPAAQRALEENNISQDAVNPTGPGGRILKEDVLRAVESRASQPSPASTAPASETQSDIRIPKSESAPSGSRDEESVAMSPMRRRIAENLVNAQHSMALLTTFNEVDMSAVMTLREKYGDAFQKKHDIKLGLMSFFVKASISALRLIPQINAEIRGESIIYKKYYDIGIAVSGKKGLVVPVLRNAETMSVAEIEGRILDFALRARDNKLTIDEIRGGTFTISNGGVFGSLLSTPIVNPPQVAILGMHTIQDRPVVVGGQIVIRPMMYVALTYDHRIVDGREAVTFLKRIKECVEDPARLALEI